MSRPDVNFTVLIIHHMKSMKFLLYVLLAFGVLSCSEEVKNQNVSDIPVIRREISSEVNKTVANLLIDGMTCSEGCGGKIQKELQALNGVVNTKLDYEENRADNTVTVEFDPSQMDEKKMIECVHAIMDGQYHVKSIEILTYKGLQS